MFQVEETISAKALRQEYPWNVCEIMRPAWLKRNKWGKGDEDQWGGDQWEKLDHSRIREDQLLFYMRWGTTGGLSVRDMIIMI